MQKTQASGFSSRYPGAINHIHLQASKRRRVPAESCRPPGSSRRCGRWPVFFQADSVGRRPGRQAGEVQVTIFIFLRGLFIIGLLLYALSQFGPS
jgi:hypothetical protein